MKVGDKFYCKYVHVNYKNDFKVGMTYKISDIWYYEKFNANIINFNDKLISFSIVKEEGINYVYDYFCTENQLRKMKLEQFINK